MLIGISVLEFMVVLEISQKTLLRLTSSISTQTILIESGFLGFRRIEYEETTIAKCLSKGYQYL